MKKNSHEKAKAREEQLLKDKEEILAKEKRATV